mgnify:CR=1 FL=1
MSTNKTQNYQLHAWAPEDEFPRTELNANFTKLDTALKAEATARTSADSAEATTRAAAVNTLTTAVAGRARVMVGSYAGQYTTTETGTRRIQLGFAPKAVFFSDADNYEYKPLMATPHSIFQNNILKLDDTGFTITQRNHSVDWVGHRYQYAVLY